MKIYVTGSSALYFWRYCEYPQRYLNARVVNPLVDCPTSREDLERIKPMVDRFGKPPLRLMTNCSDNRVLRKHYLYSIRSSSLSEMAFLQISDNICVASPEYCLMQSANVYTLPRLVELCMELCGYYSLASGSQGGFFNREHPLTSISSISCLVQSMPREIGANKLEHALQFVEGGSRSPMETREYLMLCLPKRYGGYGLPHPKINARVALNDKERTVAKRRYFECDMYWEMQGVIVEYDGHGYHESYEDRTRDAIKRNILFDKGYSVFTITGGQIMDVHAFEKVAYELAAALHHRLYQFPKDWLSRRASLRQELLRSLEG